jgi:dethiobiotin synthetase
VKHSLKRYFITGTDTGAGKTFVTTAMARRARALGQKVFAFKPIETGCELVDGRRVGADQETISAASGDWQTGELRGIYQFREPLAPFVAAQLEDTRVDLDHVVAVANSVADADLLLLEGAGGWRVPITETEDMSRLAKRLGAPVVVAARAGLGTINHSLLTLEAIERDGLQIAALVLSRRPDEDLDFALSNQEQIRRTWAGEVLLLDTNPEVLDTLVR